MNLIKKLGLAFLLSTASIVSFNRCATTTPWQITKIDSKQIGESTIITNLGTKDVDTKTFQISDAYLDGEVYKTGVTESLERITYKRQKLSNIKKMQDILTEQRKEQLDIFNPLFISLSTIGGGIIGVKIDQLDGKEGVLGGFLGGLTGGGISALIADAAKVKPITIKTETRTTATGARDMQSDEKIREFFLSSKFIYQNQTAKGIKVGVVGNQKIYTLNDGIIQWAFEKNEGETKGKLEKRLYDIPLVQEIKPNTRELLREKLLEKISKNNKTVILETREYSYNPDLIIKNCTKTLKFDYYQLTNEEIYKVINSFIDEEINSSVKTLKFIVRDDITHAPIFGSNFEFSTDSPSKSELAGRYFTGSLKTYAERYILDYIIGSETRENLPDKVEFNVYCPSNIFLEVTHPEYNFVFGEIAMENDTNRIVYMVDKGSKIRVQNSEESIGRIEE